MANEWRNLVDFFKENEELSRRYNQIVTEMRGQVAEYTVIKEIIEDLLYEAEN